MKSIGYMGLCGLGEVLISSEPQFPVVWFKRQQQSVQHLTNGCHHNPPFPYWRNPPLVQEKKNHTFSVSLAGDGWHTVSREIHREIYFIFDAWEVK